MIRFKFVSLLLFVLLISTASLSRLVNEYAAREAEQAAQTHDAIEKRLKMHRDFVLALFHVQRGQRGYLLTGNESYLDPYEYGMEHIPIMFNELKRGSVVYGTAHIFENIEPLLNTYINGMVTTVREFKAGQTQAAIAKVRTNEEKHLMDEIQGLLRQAEAKKIAFQRESQESVQQTLAFQKKSETVSFLVLFVIGATLIWLVKSKVLSSINALKKHMAQLDGNLVELQTQLPERDLDELRLELNSLIRRVWVKEQEILQGREREIQATKDHARRQEEFSSVLAHELRTPLNTLIGTIDCEKSEGKWTNDEAHKRIEMVSANLLELVNSSLDYQRMSLGHYELEFEPFDISKMLEELHSAFKTTAQSRSIHINFEASEVTNRKLLGDATKIKQVLMNLVSNALKFTPSGGRVDVLASYEKGKLRVTVNDTGVGIASDRLDLIFEPFQQADSGIKRKYGGTGIGLTLCKKIAECLKGSLTVTSQVGKGTRFIFTVPAELDLRAISVKTTASPEQSYQLNLTGSRILLVEDHILNAKINKKLLEKNFGCEIIHTETGEAAIAYMAMGHQIDLVLMDVNLGAGLSGLETTECLISTHPTCPPIVALTAGVTISQRQAVFDSGMVGLLEKPFSIDQAKSILARHCKHLTCEALSL